MRSLGRGLESLIPKTTPQNPALRGLADERLQQKESVFLIEIDKIKENPHQPRRDFNEEEIKSLADSIREHGILQPLIVTKLEEENYSGIKVFYQLIAGERRLRAAKIAGLNFIPAMIRGKTEERNKLELALIENIQRADLNAIEKARGYERLAKEFNLSQREIAERVGQSREAVANAIRLLQLPIEIQRAIENGKISEGHGKAILALDNNQQSAFLNEIISKNLSVRAAESLGRQVKGISKRIRKDEIDPESRVLESRLEEFLGTRVKLAKSGGRGNILIEFYSPEELNSILDKILR
ncbi:MAG: ParB/RepB/Spo0J family partition protein, partial [Candidatus Azambacteria bacterium]|nr:ParB/RepB/Spo0J family partition protein [Candidatus Azambacteria bacterium]